MNATNNLERARLALEATKGYDSQARDILVHLVEKGPISPIEALEQYGCMRLGARIYDLRQLGIKIRSVITKNDNGKRWSVYSLEVE